MQVIASCGVHDIAAPNTLDAFEAAIETGCDMVETDLRRCADGIVTIHDADLEGRAVRDMTRNDIEAATGARPATLDELVGCCRDRIDVDLELKEPGLEEDVLAALGGRIEPDHFLITSFFAPILERVHTLQPGTPTGLLTIRALAPLVPEHPEWMDERSAAEILAQARDIKAGWIVPDYLDHDLLRAAGAAGVPSIAWGADREQDLRALLPFGAAGLRGIITERPALLRHLLAAAPS
jgi:glycerophosphoryl diester phosphodiesterase